MNYAAFDPGAPVAMALVGSKGQLRAVATGEHVALNYAKTKWTNEPVLVAAILDHWQTMSPTGLVVVVEMAAPRPLEGLVSACKYVGSYHMVKGIAAGIGIRCIETAPAKWKRDMGLIAPKAKDKKEMSRQRAIQEWPDRARWFKKKSDHNVAEAGLIGLWCMKYGNL